MLQFESSTLVNPKLSRDNGILMTEDTAKTQEVFWNYNKNNFNKLMDGIDRIDSISIEDFIVSISLRTVFEEHIKEYMDLSTTIHDTQDKIVCSHARIRVLQERAEECDGYDVKVKQSRVNTSAVTSKTLKKVNVSPSKIMQCMKCMKVCHDGCHEEERKYANGFEKIKCIAFNGQNTCNVCSHSISDHILGNTKMEEEETTNHIRSLEEVETIETDEDLKKRYNQCVEDITKENESINELKNNLRIMEREEHELKVQISYMYTEIVGKVHTYNNIHMKEYIENERHNILNEPDDGKDNDPIYNRQKREKRLNVLNGRERIIDIMESVKQWRYGPISYVDKAEIERKNKMQNRLYNKMMNGPKRDVYRHK
jgi:Pyruvate/2-oxoacid:ferredoxin oxidoreductase delta subunit